MSQTRERYFEITLLGLILILGGILFYQATPFINGILGAITLYILLRRVNIYMTRKVSPRATPWIIVGAVTIFFLLPLSYLVWYVIDMVHLQTSNFNLQPIIDRIQHTLNSIESKTGLDLVSEDSIKFFTARVSNIAKMLMSGINNFAITLFTTLLLLFFLLSGSIKMERYIARLLPFNDNNKIAVIQNLTRIVRSNAIGIPLLAIIQGAISAVCYSLIGIPNSIEFGVLTGFASLIPIVGTMLVWIPLAISQYLDGGLIPCLYVLGCGLLIISQCDNVLRMIMQKRMANTHPLITIFGVIAGLPIFGFMGLIFGPLLVAMFLLFLNMFAHQYILGEDIYNMDPKSLTSKRSRSLSSKNKTSGSAESDFSKAHSVNSTALPHADARSSAHDCSVASSTASLSAPTNKTLGKAAVRGTEKTAGKDKESSAAKGKEKAAGKSKERSSRKTAEILADSVRTSSSAESSAYNEGKSSKGNATKSNVANASSVSGERKHSASKKDFKTAKAEHKQQKREAAKLLAQQQSNTKVEHDDTLFKDETANIESTHIDLNATLAATNTTAKSSLQQSAVDTLNQDSTLNDSIHNNTLSASNSNAAYSKPRRNSSPQLPEIDAAVLESSEKRYASMPRTVEPYNQPFGLSGNTFERRQLDGQSLVSRAVADALRPFNNSEFPEIDFSNTLESRFSTKQNGTNGSAIAIENYSGSQYNSSTHEHFNNKKEHSSAAQSTANQSMLAAQSTLVDKSTAKQSTLAPYSTDVKQSLLPAGKSHTSGTGADYNMSHTSSSTAASNDITNRAQMAKSAQSANSNFGSSKLDSSNLDFTKNYLMNEGTENKVNNNSDSQHHEAQQDGALTNNVQHAKSQQSAASSVKREDPHQQPRRLRNKHADKSTHKAEKNSGNTSTKSAHKADKGNVKSASKSQAKSQTKSTRSANTKNIDKKGSPKSSLNKSTARSERNQRMTELSSERGNSANNSRNNFKAERFDKIKRNAVDNHQKRSRAQSRTDKRQRNSSSYRSSNQGYDFLREERKKSYDDGPILTTVVSHQYGGFDPKPKSTLRTQLISMHTAKGTIKAALPRRHPSKRRPYH